MPSYPALSLYIYIYVFRHMLRLSVLGETKSMCRYSTEMSGQRALEEVQGGIKVAGALMIVERGFTPIDAVRGGRRAVTGMRVGGDAPTGVMAQIEPGEEPKVDPRLPLRPSSSHNVTFPERGEEREKGKKGGQYHDIIQPNVGILICRSSARLQAHTRIHTHTFPPLLFFFNMHFSPIWATIDLLIASRISEQAMPCRLNPPKPPRILGAGNWQP
ncbi:hypothetical protein F5X96DRAFT_413651 [Biscogniauxia mediterranea]|nr:hypothetical protein F5X96DRAFT_413651 [Biscogniauxia mediterranea]